AETHYLVDPAGELSHVVADLDAAGNPTARYLRADDELLAVIRDGESRYVHADGIGSIRVLTDETGAVTDRYAYSAFGEPLAHDGADPQPYRFAGEPYDTSSGFAYHRARWMDPSAGRFASMDPWSGSPFDPASLHRYTYAANDPVLVVDPTGRMTVTEALVVVGARMALVGMTARLGQVSWRYAGPALKGLRWTQTALQRLGAHFKQAQVLSEEAVHGSRGRIDLVVSRGVDKVTRIAVELKAWNLDRIANRSEDFQRAMLQKLEDQATRFVQGQGLGKTYDDLVYGFSTAPITEKGLRFFEAAIKVLEKAGVVRDNIAVGADKLIEALERLL
ncbi:MAG: RHS repeat-associated core domain-containing protein, partial [Candidatus Schekmanbacteria bacterium]|nr:RHS repeat-associated core domain-containing protein [Candidatus Schekmanbacteria bacterium]